MQMNILILSPLDITGLNHGGALRTYNIAKRLADSGNKVTLITYFYMPKRGTFIEKHGENLVVVKTTWGKFLFSYLVPKAIKADVIQVEFVSTCFILPFLRAMGKHTVLDEHGVEIEFSEDNSKALGRKLKLHTYLRTFFLEFLGTKFSSVIFVCSKLDGAKLRRIYKISERKIVVIPNGVDEKFFETIEPYKYGKPAILFFGSFDHPPNIFAAKFLLTDIIPQVFSQNEEALFAFVGRKPPPWLTSCASERIKIFGNVDDVRPFIAGAKVVVVPIFHGSGTRIKILESASMGKPVVSTSKGAEGLNFRNGQSILIRESSQEFVRAILQLLDNQSLAEEIGSNAKELSMKKFRWSQIITKVLRAYKSICHISE
jgi:glycosyltransferase involved in cell wall biosynthesis